MLCKIRGSSKHHEGQYSFLKKPEESNPSSIISPQFTKLSCMSDNTKRFRLIKRPYSLWSQNFWPSILDTHRNLPGQDISVLALLKLRLRLSYHFTTEVLFVHIPENFQHINRANERATYRHTDEYSQGGTRLSFYSAVGTFNWNKEHWLSCWTLLITHMAPSDFLFPPFT